MRVNTPLMTVVGGAAGAVFAVVSFQSHAPDARTPTAFGSRPTDSAALTSAPRITTMWLPCVKGSHLRHGACVTVRHRVVTVIDPAPVVVAPVTPVRSAARPAPATQRPARHHSKAHHSSGDDGNDSGDDGAGDDGPEPGDD
jgi:hypothetical protein